MKHCSVILVHYSRIDDFGETSAGRKPPNRSDLVRECVENLIVNTDYPAEFIVMDNGGNPDDTDFFLQKVREKKINTLVRFKDNLHFAMAWNLGAKISSGEYLSFICNDVVVKPKWLSSCIEVLEKYPGRKLVATPFITYDKRKMTTVIDGFRFNPRSGSNCMVLKRELFYEIGEFPHHRIGGTLWYDRIKSMKILTVAPLEDLAVDKGYRHGVNFSIPIKVKKILSDKSEVDFSAPNQ